MFEDMDINDSSLEVTECNVPVLTFEHPLTMEEKEKIVYEIMGNNQLKQVYFVDEVDIETIEFVKLLLEYSADVMDEHIEKAILMRNNNAIITDILNMSFKNPDTWFVSFKNNGVSYEVVDIPSLRIMEKYLTMAKNKIEKRASSNLEKILLAYDLVKLLDYSNVDDLSSIPVIIKDKVANSKGFNLLFNTILNRLGVKSYMGEIIANSDISYITLVNVEDEKYSIDGMYLFEPTSDNLPLKKYKDNGVRRLNYNFFGLSVDSFYDLKTGDELTGILSVLAIQSDVFRHQRMDILSKRDNGISKRAIEESLGISIDEIYNKCFNAKLIGIDTIMEVIASVCYANDYTENKKLDIMSIIKNNYENREQELFESKIVTDEISDI